MNPQHRHPNATHNATTQTLQTAAESKASMHKGPTHDEIARRAHAIYEKQGCQDGRCKQNWKQAEHELAQVEIETQNSIKAMDNEHDISHAFNECDGQDASAVHAAAATHRQ